MNTLQKRIYKIGIENCMFIAGFQPICSILGLISYTVAPTNILIYLQQLLKIDMRSKMVIRSL